MLKLSKELGTQRETSTSTFEDGVNIGKFKYNNPQTRGIVSKVKIEKCHRFNSNF